MVANRSTPQSAHPTHKRSFETPASIPFNRTSPHQPRPSIAQQPATNPCAQSTRPTPQPHDPSHPRQLTPVVQPAVAAAMSAKPRRARASALYGVVYALLWLVHAAQQRVVAACAWMRARRMHARASRPLPPHIALSGAIAHDLPRVLRLVARLVANGARDVTLHDPDVHIDVQALPKLVANLVPTDAVWSLADMSAAHTLRQMLHVRSLHSGVPHDARQLGRPDVNLTVLRPNAPRAPLVRAAQHLAALADGKRVTPDEVMKWLDDDELDCMLPSEPDVVVVFPTHASRVVKSLNGFPIWQLRLTQIRFAPLPVNQTSDDYLLGMLSNAAGVPKRFGR